jgi:hypothetical protein
LSTTDSGLFLALELDGRDHSPRALRETVAAAERAGFTLVTFTENPGDTLDAGTRAAFVSSSTDTVGLAPTVHTLTTEPFFLATQLASVDHTSHGRGAWVVGADNSVAAHDAVGSTVRETDSIRQEIRDVIDVSRRLWDSWEDDAVIRDAASGRYLDPEKVHHVRFEGEFFDIVGPLITPRPPQGQPVVVGDVALGVTDLLDVAVVRSVDQIDDARTDGAPLVFLDVDADVNVASVVDVVDGLLFRPAGAEARRRLLDNTVPKLADAGLLRRPVAGRTLRENLGLPRPVSRYAAAKENS